MSLNLDKDSLNLLNSPASTGYKPQKTTGTLSLKPGKASKAGDLMSVIVSPTHASETFLMAAVKKPT